MDGTLRILCLEDQEDDFEILNFTLEASGLEFISKRVDSREEYLEALETFRPDIILSDHALPQFNSTEALKICQEQNNNIPFILVTGAVSDEFAVNCIKLGAVDYLLKSSLSRLPSAIDGALKHKKAEDEKSHAISALGVQNDQLLKINAELDSFVYSVSHNLRAPLMSVLGLLHLAEQETNVTNMRAYHQMMETSIQKLDETLKEILDYSRNARQDIRNEPIEIRKIIDDNLSRLQFMPGFKSLQIIQSIDDTTPFVSDPYRISVIMNNLISNAVKYLDQGKENSFLKISVAIDPEYATLLLEDNGIGIDHAQLPKIFDMFFRATEQREGAGLGLYIVKEAIEKLKGTIRVESKTNQGTQFHIRIPNLADGSSQ
ncbi:MAG TPA: hybrid sensor histidine kinase/response regulator [Ohtaekwangia sp.]